MSQARPRILVADDQPDILEALRLLLKGEGYDVFLVLEATVGFNRREEEESASEPVRATKSSTATPDLQINAQDLRFLKSLRISLSESRDIKDSAA